MSSQYLMHAQDPDMCATDGPNKPHFSIVMPAYNAQDTIGRAVASVLSQTYDDWELIVVEDGSSDATRNRAREAARGDSRVRILSQENAGVATARNTAVAAAHGEFVCFLDSDDEMLPDYLEAMQALIEANPEYALFSVNARCVEPSGAVSLWRSSPKFEIQRSFTLRELLDDNHVFIMSTMRIATFRSLGGMNSRIPRSEDYELWLRALASGHQHIYTPQVLGVYHRQATSLSSNQKLESLSIVEIMQSLLQSDVLGPGERRIARRRMRSATARAELERRRIEGDYSGGRLEALATLSAFSSRRRRLAGVVLALVGPGRFFRALSARRDEQLAELYVSSEDGQDSD